MLSRVIASGAPFGRRHPNPHFFIVVIFGSAGRNAGERIIMSNAALTEVGPHGAAKLSAPLNEDWLAVILGLAIFVLALAGLVHIDLIGWVVNTSVWSNFGQALGPASKTYASLGGFGALLVTYAALTVVLSAGAAALKTDVKKFALAFTAVFWIAYASWIIGNFAHFAAVTPAEKQKFGIDWSLGLTNEGAYIFALLTGLVIANFLPRFADSDQGSGAA